MRNFLLTWYGIADLRASLGFENTEGPIASALAAEPYSDVLVLGYTRADNNSMTCSQAQQSFTSERDAIYCLEGEKNREAANAFIAKFANTSAAHAHFISWLKERAEKTGARIHFQDEKLRELNDTEGIYACAIRALSWVAQESDNAHVTLYLSPGTPVMAFVWAFAALNYPDLKNRLIASPVIGKAPEVIPLPAEWLERHGAKQAMLRSAVDEEGCFDVVYHLFGEQRMPSLLGVRQFDSKRHIFLSSASYPAACMKPFIQDGGFDELTVDPWNARDTHETIIRHAHSLPSKTRIGINLTGGTKLMFAGALSAARALGAAPFYFDAPNRSVTFIDSLRRTSIKPIDSTELFLSINSDGLKLAAKSETEGMPQDRQRLIEMLWQQRYKVSKCYKELAQYSKTFVPFHIQETGLDFKLDENRTATARVHGLNVTVPYWPDFAKFLCGGWFEEYVYLLCKPYQDKGVIHDLRINVTLTLGTPGQQGCVEYNEIDLVFTDGYSLYIVECKAGNVKQEQVMKLQNLVRIYGGVQGRGILACAFPLGAESIKKKTRDAQLTLWQGVKSKPFSAQIKELMDGIDARAKFQGMVA